jgi:hypothetical protein
MISREQNPAPAVGHVSSCTGLDPRCLGRGCECAQEEDED